MKIRYKIAIITAIVVFSILFIPPNVAAFSCNTLNHKDLHCHVVGMTFFGIPLQTSIYHWFEWNESIGCGGILAHPEKVYPCIGIEDYWGYPAMISPFSEKERFVDNLEKNGNLSFSNQECAELFDRIHQEFKDKPCPCCNPPPGEPVCEPPLFEIEIAANREFRDSGCESTYKEWVHLTNDAETASWAMHPSYFNIDMLKANLSKEIPIAVTYRGYDECISLKAVIKHHEGNRPIFAERSYENICSINEQKEYRLPLYKIPLTDYGEPVLLPKGNYQLLLYKMMDGEVIDEESTSIGQFFFSSHYDHDAQSEELDYDYTKLASEVLRDARCAEWFEKIMYTAEHSGPEFDLKYELKETNVFRDLQCANFVTEWESLTDYDVWDIGISWNEISN